MVTSRIPPLSLPEFGEFDARRQHAFNKLVYDLPIGGGKFLDIGCGMGNGVIAALQVGFDLAVGVDRSLHEFDHDMPKPFELLCDSYRVPKERALRIAGDLFEMQFDAGSFDAAMMLDSIEHVPNPQRFLEFAFRVTRPGGLFLVDTCPLYFSSKGHHLWQYFDEPWAHLRRDFSELLHSRGVDDWSKERFRELNRITHEQIVLLSKGVGFEIVREHRSTPSSEDLKIYESVRNELDWSLGFSEAQLFEDWILVVLRHPKGSAGD